jgi:hypothetical protein
MRRDGGNGNAGFRAGLRGLVRFVLCVGFELRIPGLMGASAVRWGCSFNREPAFVAFGC